MADNTFTLRKNAVRAAKALIAKGEAPGNQYTIEPAGDRFALYWKPDEAAIAALEDTTEAAFYERQPPNLFPDGSLVIARADGTAGWHPATVLYRCATDGGAFWRVQFAGRADATLRQEPDIQIVDPDRHAALVAEIEGTKGNFGLPAKPKAVGRPPSSNGTEAAVAVARGELPARPEITSPTNQRYVPRFKKLEALAAAGDWAAVEAFPVNGKNTYAKMLIRYREQMLTAHLVQQGKAEEVAA